MKSPFILSFFVLAFLLASIAQAAGQESVAAAVRKPAAKPQPSQTQPAMKPEIKALADELERLLKTHPKFIGNFDTHFKRIDHIGAVGFNKFPLKEWMSIYDKDVKLFEPGNVVFVYNQLPKRWEDAQKAPDHYLPTTTVNWVSAYDGNTHVLVSSSFTVGPPTQPFYRGRSLNIFQWKPAAGKSTGGYAGRWYLVRSTWFKLTADTRDNKY